MEFYREVNVFMCLYLEFCLAFVYGKDVDTKRYCFPKLFGRLGRTVGLIGRVRCTEGRMRFQFAIDPQNNGIGTQVHVESAEVINEY